MRIAACARAPSAVAQSSHDSTQHPRLRPPQTTDIRLTETGLYLRLMMGCSIRRIRISRRRIRERGPPVMALFRVASVGVAHAIIPPTTG